MSIKSEPIDEILFKAALNELRSDQGDLYRKSWLIVGHVDQNPQKIHVCASNIISENPFKEICDVLKNDQVMYALIRLTTTFDMSTTVKFVYIHWVGEKVPFAKKGRFGVVGGSVKDFFTPFHLFIQTSFIDDLTEENITKQLEESSGTRNKVLEGSLEGRQMRGFTAHSQTTQAKTELKSIVPSAYTVKVSEELENSIKEVRKGVVAWVLASFDNDDFYAPLILNMTGNDDVDSLKKHLNDDLLQFALLRTSDVYDSIATVKFVYILWIGEKVKPMKKGKLSAYAGAVEKVFSPVHVSFTFSNLGDIHAHVIKDKVQASSGSKISVK